MGDVVRAYVAAHPYEEPAFDLYPVEDVLPGVGLGRVGALPEQMCVRLLAGQAAEVYEVPGVTWSGDGDAMVQRVGVLPGSGRGCIENAAGQCDALITSDMAYHDADQAAEKGVALIDVPHGEFEWWAFKRWVGTLPEEFVGGKVAVTVSQEWQSPWSQLWGGGRLEGRRRG